MARWGVSCQPDGMKFRTLILAAAFLAVGVVASAIDLSTHAYFKHLIGKWKAAGDLTNSEGKVLKVTEDWTGKVDAEGGFYIEGSRTIDGDTQPFKWSITHNPAIDTYEAVLTGGQGSQEVRFEGSLSEVNLTMVLKAITGSGESSITVEDSFVDEAKDTFQSKVKFIGEQGQTNLEGTIVHKRDKEP